MFAAAVGGWASVTSRSEPRAAEAQLLIVNNNECPHPLWVRPVAKRKIDPGTLRRQDST
jgi:hypothetical protein